jgi:hypothetical protein
MPPWQLQMPTIPRLASPQHMLKPYQHSWRGQKKVGNGMIWHKMLLISTDGDISRFDRLRRLLGLHQHTPDGQPVAGTLVDLDELRKECWLGIPQRIRPLAWRILSVSSEFRGNLRIFLVAFEGIFKLFWHWHSRPYDSAWRVA